jgi:hypothetical protein
VAKSRHSVSFVPITPTVLIRNQMVTGWRTVEHAEFCAVDDGHGRIRLPRLSYQNDNELALGANAAVFVRADMPTVAAAFCQLRIRSHLIPLSPLRMPSSTVPAGGQGIGRLTL